MVNNINQSSIANSMHGIHIAADIVKTAKEQGKVKHAVIEVGEIANITVSDLEKQLKSVAPFPFEMREVKAIVKCKCGYEGSPEIIERQHEAVIFTCPECGETPEVIQGGHVILKEVEV